MIRRPSTTPRRALPGALLVAGLAACGPSSRIEYPGPGEVELGWGITELNRIADDQRVPIVHGVQGGFHIWGAMRARYLDPTRLDLEYSLTRRGEPDPYTVRVEREVDLDGGDGGRSFGLRLGTAVFLPEVEHVRGRDCRFRVEARDRFGRQAAAERRVIPE